MALTSKFSQVIIYIFIFNILQISNQKQCQNICSGNDPATLQLEGFRKEKNVNK